MSLPVSSLVMNPYPFDPLKNFTVPVMGEKNKNVKE
jgi:hypothetical protein